MIYLSSSDDFIKKSLTNLISQINPHLTTFEKNLSFAYIEVQKSNDQLYLFYCEKKEIVRTPIKINDIFDTIYRLIFEKVVNINKFEFYPFKQIISYKDTEIKLNFISNEILRNLYLYRQNGIDKNILYSLIWPQDKEILINKLDTHLTNTKNLIQDNFNIEIKYASKKGILKLLD
jgi:DNA-binding response OmpR family regulator